MKTTDLYNTAGCNAVQYAVESGAYPSVQAWETAKTRESDIPADRLELIRDALAAHIREQQALLRVIKKECKQ